MGAPKGGKLPRTGVLDPTPLKLNKTTKSHCLKKLTNFYLLHTKGYIQCNVLVGHLDVKEMYYNDVGVLHTWKCRIS